MSFLRRARPGDDGWSLARFLIVNAAIGALVTAVFIGVLLAADIAKLRTLLWATHAPFTAFYALFMSLFATFGAAVLATAIAQLAHDPPASSGRRRRTPAAAPRLVPALLSAGRDGQRQ